MASKRKILTLQQRVDVLIRILDADHTFRVVALKGGDWAQRLPAIIQGYQLAAIYKQMRLASTSEPVDGCPRRSSQGHQDVERAIHVFFCRNQDAGETVESYITSLRKMVTTCMFGRLEDRSWESSMKISVPNSPKYDSWISNSALTAARLLSPANSKQKPWVSVSQRITTYTGSRTESCKISHGISEGPLTRRNACTVERCMSWTNDSALLMGRSVWSVTDQITLQKYASKQSSK